MTRQTLLDSATTVFSVALLLIVGHTYLATDRAKSAPAAVTGVAMPVPPGLADTGTVLGDPAAPLRIVEFADYQCSYCAAAQPSLERLVTKFQGQVAVVFRHFPIRSIHPHAIEAAQAAECAGDQNAFLSMHNVLYRQQQRLGGVSWTTLARKAGVTDTVRFKECLQSERHLSRVVADMRAGEAVGVQGTPSLLVNGVRYNGMPSDVVLDSIVRATQAFRAPSLR